MASKKKKRWASVTTIHSFKNASVVRVFGITRVSTDKQAKKIGESLDHQKEVLQNWVRCKSSLHMPQKWELVETFVENEDKNGTRRGRTATVRAGREGLRKALTLAAAKLIDVVLVTKLDRIARNVGDYIEISAEFNESGTALVCLDLDIDTSTPDGQMIMRNHANLAQWQAERIAQYSLETVRRHTEQGRPLGSPPVGYKSVRDSLGHNSFAIDPKHKKHLTLIDELYLQHKSSDKVVLELHNRGYKSPRGRTYTKSQVTRMLQNIRYTGQQDYEGKIYKGNWPPLRSIETYEKIQKILGSNRRTNHSEGSPSWQKYPYLLQGLLKCQNCHSSMMPKPGTGGRKTKRYYPYYFCVKADKTKGIDCDGVYLPAEALDYAVVQFIRNLRLDITTIENVIARANAATNSRLGALNNDFSQVKDSLQQIRTKTSNLVDILAAQGVSKLESLRGKLEELNEEEQDLIRQEKLLEQEINSEKRLAVQAKEQIQTLHLFNDIFLLNKNVPDRLKAIFPRFIKYVICEMSDREKGIGKIVVGLFGKPYAGSENSELWNEALKEIAEQISQQLVSEGAKNGKHTGNKLTKSLGKSPANDSDEPLGIIESMPNEFVRGLHMGWATGIEPATPRSTILCSNQLSYAHHNLYQIEILLAEL